MGRWRLGIEVSRKPRAVERSERACPAGWPRRVLGSVQETGHGHDAAVPAAAGRLGLVALGQLASVSLRWAAAARLRSGRCRRSRPIRRRSRSIRASSGVKKTPRLSWMRSAAPGGAAARRPARRSPRPSRLPLRAELRLAGRSGLRPGRGRHRQEQARQGRPDPTGAAPWGGAGRPVTLAPLRYRPRHLPHDSLPTRFRMSLRLRMMLVLRWIDNALGSGPRQGRWSPAPARRSAGGGRRNPSGSRRAGRWRPRRGRTGRRTACPRRRRRGRPPAPQAGPRARAATGTSSAMARRSGTRAGAAGGGFVHEQACPSLRPAG